MNATLSTSARRPRPLLNNAPGYALFFSMLFLPTTYHELKAALLAVVLIAAVARIARGRAPVDRGIAKLFLYYATFGAALALYGMSLNTVGALPNARIFVAWPFLYVIIIAAGSTHRETVRHLTGVLLVGAVAVQAYATVYVLVSRGVLPQWAHVDLDLGQNIGFYEGQTGFTMFSVSSLVFLVPFVIATIIIRPATLPFLVPRWAMYALATLGAALAIVSGRRGLMMAIAVSPFVALLLRQWVAPRHGREWRLPWAAWGFVTTVAATLGPRVLRGLMGIDMRVIYGELLAVTTKSNVSTYMRQTQFRELMSAWEQAPFFGQGLGAHLPHFTVSVDHPWAYELSYVALLFQIGVVGVAAYAAGLVWMLRQSRAIANADCEAGLWLLPVMTATLCFLLANATNPYLAKFDYLWVIFLPVLLINFFRVHRGDGRPAN